jgi:catechol 2,3-dioxygenase-like lactoylglutathione lyase family enzyme/extradiol dioxygenase family protein
LIGEQRDFFTRSRRPAMFKIGKLFHLTHVVDDLAAVDRWYDEIFACQRFYHGYEKLAGRDASLLAIGEAIMEPMAPARAEPLRNLSVKKFHARFGQHFHSIAWYVDEVNEIAEKLDRNGLRLYDIVGKQVQPPLKATAFWTHPRETPGQLEFALYGDFIADPRMVPGWSASSWRDYHPLGIERVSRIVIVVRDLVAAQRLYVELLEGKLIHETESPGGKRSAFVAVGTDTVVELAQPLSGDGEEARDLVQNGEGIHAMIFKTRNLARATEFLRAKGTHPQIGPDGTALLGREEAFGMIVGFTELAIPNYGR